MNILFINSARTWGGGERWLIDICTGLSANHHKVYVACNPGSVIGHKIPASVAETVPVNISGDCNPVTIFRLYSLMKEKHIDIVCTNFEKDLRVGGLAAVIAGIPVVTSREVDFPIKNKRLNKFFYTRVASAILVNSFATLNTLLVNSPWLKKQRMKVVWKGIPDFPVPGASIEKTTLHPDSTEQHIHIGFVGRLDEQKGIPTLLEAMHIAVRTDPSLQLIMAGEGNLLTSIREYARLHHLEDNILVAGFQHHVDSFLSAVDFVVMPSYWEGFGYTALEAMMLGKAVVATHTSSLPEIIIDGKTGILVPPRSPEKLAEAIVKLSQDASLRERMGTAGAERVKEVFTLASMVSETETLFRDVINGTHTTHEGQSEETNGMVAPVTLLPHHTIIP